MKEFVSNGNLVTPMLFPYEPEQFWKSIREIIREEVNNAEKQRPVSPASEATGLTYKPLYKITEVCAMFHVTKPTIYDWIKHGKLKSYKIRSRVYFLWNDIQHLLHPEMEK